MDSTDLSLLEHVGGRSARVVVLATAAGREPAASPERWTRMGIQHFARLGVRAEPVDILAREDACDPRWLPLLEAADFFYFSGGDPLHLVQTLKGSPAWQVIRARHATGAVLAGCSAGAMAFGGFTFQPRTLWRSGASVSQKTEASGWSAALAVVPGVIVLPHFDRMTSRMGRDTLARLVASVPAGRTLIGVEDDTALVCLDGSAGSTGSTVWQVMGRQSVSVFVTSHAEVRHAAGADVVLDANGAF